MSECRGLCSHTCWAKQAKPSMAHSNLPSSKAFGSPNTQFWDWSVPLQQKQQQCWGSQIKSRSGCACAWASPREHRCCGHPFICLPSSNRDLVWLFVCAMSSLDLLFPPRVVLPPMRCNLLRLLEGGQGQMACFRLIKGLPAKEKWGGSRLAWYLFLVLSTGGLGDKLEPDGDELHYKEHQGETNSPLKTLSLCC